MSTVLSWSKGLGGWCFFTSRKREVWAWQGAKWEGRRGLEKIWEKGERDEDSAGAKLNLKSFPCGRLKVFKSKIISYFCNLF